LQISLEKLIQMIADEVVKELKKQGVKVISSSNQLNVVNSIDALRTKSEKIDMSKYRTPILTENHIRHLHELTGEVIVPSGTIITPKARELIKAKGIQVKFE